MFDNLITFTAWPILTGILVGYVANKLVSGQGKGCCMNLVIGVAGSYVGTFVAQLFDVSLLGASYAKNFALCVIGSALVLWVFNKLFG